MEVAKPSIPPWHRAPPDGSISIPIGQLLLPQVQESSKVAINSVELLREVYRNSLSSDYVISRDVKHKNDYSWLLGDVAVKAPLLDLIEVTRGDFSMNEPMKLRFVSENIEVSSTADTQWIDKQGRRASIGDLLLFALQLQCGISNSLIITSLGHLPVSILLKKYLTNLLQDVQSDPKLLAPNNYSPDILTPVDLIEQTSPMQFASSESFFRIFGIRPELSSLHVLISGQLISNFYTSKQENLSVIKDDATSTVPGSQTDKPNSISPSSLVSLLDQHRKIPSSKKLILSSSSCSFPTSIEIDPVDFSFNSSDSSHNTEKILSHEILKSYSSHLLPQLSHVLNSLSPDHHTNKTKSVRTETKVVNRLERLQPYPSPHLNNKPSSRLYNLWGYLVSKKLKPIIIVPSSLISNLIHMGNCRQFLEQKELPLTKDSKTLLDFPINEDVPMIANSKGNEKTRSSLQSVSVDFKIIGDSQVKKFQRSDWLRVVTVIVQGPEWQFQHWPFSDLRHMFSLIKGVYFGFESDKLPSLIGKFPIDVLRLKRNTRHSDITAWRQFVGVLGSVLEGPRNFEFFDLK